MKRVSLGLVAVLGTTALGALVAPRALHQFQLVRAADEPALLADLRLAGQLDQGRITTGIEQALVAGDIELADSFVALARERDISLPAALQDRIDAARANGVGRAVSDFGHGFIAGARESDAAFAGALVGDVSGFGDLRDLATEGRKLIAGEPADETIVALAAVGLAVSAATWISLGGGVPARGGLSAVKAATKARLVSPALSASLTRAAAGAIDRPALAASVNAAGKLDMAAAGLAARGIVRPAAMARFAALGQDAGTLYARTGQRGVRQVLTVAEDAGDIGKASRLSVAKGSTTRATLKVLGRGALVLGALSLQAIGWMFALVGYALALAMAAQRFGYWLGRRRFRAGAAASAR